LASKIIVNRKRSSFLPRFFILVYSDYIKVNLFSLLEMPLTVPGIDWLGNLIGQALTGVVVSRGADYLLVL
jgi:hypothetical protein